MQVTREDLPTDILAHYGVKGMKWGVRKDRATIRRERRERRRKDKESVKRGKALYKAQQREYRKMSRKERKAADQRDLQIAADSIIETVMGDPDSFVSVSLRKGTPPIMATGKEFIEHLAAGGAFDARYTQVIDAKTGKVKGGFG